MSYKNNIPQLRFTGFELEWDLKKLGELSDLITKGTTPKKFVKKGIRFIKLECFEGDRINPNKCLLIDEATHNKELKRSILCEGDILFAIAGATIGKVNIVNNEILPANTNQALSIVRLKVNENREFIYHNLKSDIMRRYILDNISVGAQPNLNLEQMNNFSFFLPSLQEQQKIASFISAVDEKIQQLSRKKELLEQYKKGVMQQLFSGKLRFKNENGKDYADWEEKKLGDIADFYKGKGLPKSDIVIDGKYKCLHYGELFTKYKETISNIISNTNNYDKPFLSNVNDVLMPTSDVTPNGLATASCINENEVILGGDVLVIRQKVKFFDGIFFSYYVTQNREKVMKLVSGSTVYHLYGSDMKKLEIQLPSLSEQQKIANFLSSIDAKIESTNQQMIQMQSFKKGLLQQLFV